MQKEKLFFKGKTKNIYLVDESDLLIMEFMDAYHIKNDGCIESIQRKGFFTNQISQRIFRHLENHGIKTHFIKGLSDTDMAIRKLNMIMLEVVLRNIAAGSLINRLGIDPGTILENNIIEYYYKNDKLDNPLINPYHIYALNLVTREQLDKISELVIQINDLLIPFFAERNLNLVDYRLEFGMYHNEIILADEISPDTCRLWDTKTGEKFDEVKNFRDKSRLEKAYEKLYERINMQ